MAFRRSVTTRAKLLYQQQRVAVPFSHIDRDDNHRENPIYKSGEILLRRPPFWTGDTMGSYCGSRNLFQDRRFAIPAAFAPVFVRNMSTLGEGAGADEIEIMTDVFGENAVEVASQVAPVVSEVAVAAADSFLPVAAVQYMIDYVHTLTGLDWWASIVLTIVLFRTLQLPLTISEIKFISKFNERIRPQMEEIQEEMKSRLREMMSRDMSPGDIAEFLAPVMEKLMNICRVHPPPYNPVKRIQMVGLGQFCCFTLAVNNMAEKVQSFKDGGALWFTDLTTPDPMLIFPVLIALTFWIKVESESQSSETEVIENVSRVILALSIPLTACFPKAVLCYWITSRLYSRAFRWVIEKPEVKKMLGIPDSKKTANPRV